jgi:Fe-S cluster assembly protein SufD
VTTAPAGTPGSTTLPDPDRVAALSAALGEPSWLTDHRLAALAALDDGRAEPPARDDEAWRFTPWRRFALEAPVDGAAPEGAPPEVEGDGVDVLPLGPAAAGEERLVASLLPDLAGTTRLEHLHAALRDEGWLVRARRGTSGATVRLAHRLTAAGEVRRAHVLVVCEPGSELTVVERHDSPGLDGPALWHGTTQIVLARGARLRHVALQEWEGPARHLGHIGAAVGQEAELRSIVVTLGGEVVRLTPAIDLAGRGASVEGLGVVFAGPGQHVEHRLTITHSAPDATSDLLYKGAVEGERAQSVFVGDVRIPTTGTGALTRQTNRNVVLTDGAVARSIPFLEIEPNDLRGASHASATGRIDEEALFYLESRGIDPPTAVRLILAGFFGDVLDRLPRELGAVRERLQALVDARLDRALP